MCLYVCGHAGMEGMCVSAWEKSVCGGGMCARVCMQEGL